MNRSTFRILAAATLTLAAVGAFAQSGPAPAYPLRLSADGRYVVDQANRPFFLNGEAAWALLAQTLPEEAEAYLADRARKGYNAVLVTLVEHKFAVNAPANRAGVQPFKEPGNFNTPNEPYFAHADWLVTKAAEHGIAVLFVPLYPGYKCGDEGWCAEIKQNSPLTMRDYGRYLGNRYKGFPNVLWVVGGDADPFAHGLDKHFREFVAGLREVDTVHLITAHNAPEQSAMDVWTNEPWLSLNNVYTYRDSYPKALSEYRRQGAKPFFLMETAYENEHGSTPQSLRRQAYWTVLSGGAVGHIFGNCPIWSFGAPSAATFCKSSAWQEHLGSDGSTTLAYLGRLFGSRAFHLLVPDADHRVLTAGYESGATYAAAARAGDGSSVIAYLPTRRAVTLDMTRISGAAARAWWFDPRTASATEIGTFPTSGAAVFTPPADGDWVLVVDDATRNLGAPGDRTGGAVPPAAPSNLRLVE